MKKFLMIAAVIGLVAGQAMAGMVPYTGGSVPVQQLSSSSYNVKSSYINPAYSQGGVGGGRGLLAGPYVPNDPAAVFDNMPVSFGFAGPGTSLWFYASSFPAGAVYWDDFVPTAGTTSMTELKWFYGDFGSYTSGTHTQVFVVATGTPSAVNLTGVVASFALSGLPSLSTFFAAFSVPIDLTAIFGPGGIPNPGGTLWYGWGHFSFVGNPTMFGNGWPTVEGSNAFIQSAGAIGNPTAFYVGNSGLRACLSSGTSLTCFSSVLTFGSIYSMNWAFNGIPEPSVIGLLAIGGLFALRRRKA
jgi:hypothetical protein